MKSCFDFAKVDNFDAHIRNSIPSIDHMYRLCHNITYTMSQEHTKVVDLGCSTGKFLLDTPKRDRVTYQGVDRSFLHHSSQVSFLQEDIRDYIRSGGLDGTSVCLSLFTLQFMPFYERQSVLESIGRCLVGGGVAIVAEKCSLADHRLSSVIERSLAEWKRTNFSDTEILDKSAKLAASMHVDRQKSVVQMMERYIGPTSIVWANGEFMCAVAVKDT